MKEGPHRVQLSRKKGWRMPPNTVKVDRTTQWGNPFKGESREVLVKRFREWISLSKQREFVERARVELKGKNLACWARLTGKERALFSCARRFLSAKTVCKLTILNDWTY